jgi:dienelactone hydrolase
MPIRVRLLAWTGMLLGSACQERAVLRGARPSTRVGLREGYYDAHGAAPAPLCETVLRRTRDLEVRRVLLPPRVPADLAWIARAHEPIELTVYRPLPDGPPARPLVVMSPVLGNRMLLMPEFATAFTANGFVAAVVQRKEVDLDPHVAIDQAEGELRLLVLRKRQALDWLLTLPDVDATRVATFGVSAGSMVSAMTAGVDPRFRAHVWVFGGGPMADVMTDTVEDRFRRYGEQVRRAHGWTKADVRDRLRTTIQTDPVRLAANVPREDVLLFLARLDTSVPIRHGWTLYHALGGPELRLLPLGHRGSFLFLPYILSESTRFLRRKFAEPATNGSRAVDGAPPGLSSEPG